MFRIVRSTHEGETAWALAGELTSREVREARSLPCADLIGLVRIRPGRIRGGRGTQNLLSK